MLVSAPNAYCINLNRRPDRWKLAQQQFQQHGLQVERFEAIDAREHKITPVQAFTASHKQVIEKAKADNLRSVIVFEDDVVLHEHFMEEMVGSAIFLPADWHILYLGGTHRQKPIPVNEHILRVTQTLTTHAYIMRNTLYDVALERLYNSNEPADCVYAALQKEYNCYVTNPPLAWQRGGFSDIEGRFMDYPWLQTNEQ